MGEARRKKLTQAVGDNSGTIDEVVLAHVASAIRRLAEAASGSLGSDCQVHAQLCSTLLNELGIQTRVVIGFAGWRVGEGDGDVVLHAPVKNSALQPGAAPYHAWLEFGPSHSARRLLIDFTTYQMHKKAAALDALDGGKTRVDWCPNYLVATAADVSTLSRVTQGGAGLFFYEARPDIEALVAPQKIAVDEADLAALRLLYANQSLTVIGPNDVGAN